MTMTKTRWVLVGLLCLALATLAYVVVREVAWGTYYAAGIKAAVRGDYPEAKRQLGIAIKVAEMFGHQDRLGETFGNLALIYSKQGRYAEAEPLHKRALAIAEKTLGSEHRKVALALNNLGWNYSEQGKYAEAEPFYKRSLAIYEKVRGPEHPDLARPLWNYAALLLKTGRYTEATKLMARAEAIRAKRQVRPRQATSSQADYQTGWAAYKRGDYATALREFRPLANQGLAGAQFSLGLMYRKGRGVPQDYAEALKWYRKAAEQGYAPAQYNLGFAYEHGYGVPQDYAEAVKWYRKAAEQGVAYAQNSLGFMYRKGRGVQQDYAEALKWYRKATEQGNAPAQYNLGFAYEHGYGVPQDYAEAMRWYRKAAEQGHAEAKEALRELETYEDIGFTLTHTFPKPTYRGRRVDWCKRWARECGGPAATAFCRRRGFGLAAAWAKDENIGATNPTVVIEDNAVCNRQSCDGFRFITCR